MLLDKYENTNDANFYAQTDFSQRKIGLGIKIRIIHASC